MHPSSCFIFFLSLFLNFFPKYVFANSFLSCSVRPSCGSISNIDYPFWGSDLNRPESCGYPGFQLHCNENEPEITIMDVTYRVLAINNSSKTLNVSRTDYRDDICPTRFQNSSFENSPFQYTPDTRNISLYYGCQSLAVPVNLTSIRQISHQFECPINERNTMGYYVIGDFWGTAVGNYLGLCSDRVIIPVPNSQVSLLERNQNPDALEEAVKVGFILQWSADDTQCEGCLNDGGQCGRNSTGEFECYYCPESEGDLCPKRSPGGNNIPAKLGQGLGIGIAGAAVVGILLGIGVLRFRQQRQKMNDHAEIEAFIKKFGSLTPRRYFYGEIKKMTNKFSDKLGQGGYGTVYKGKFPDGRLVAVKVLGESKGNGEDFMNEVASVSRTSHVNIVTLLGFCFERSKRALVYEFMPHGSLDRFIYDRVLHHQNRQLEWKTLYDIAVGIARGLEYLHQGCNTRILHFDIKPHNILLDGNFCPKISDFGLSKLCERMESVISMACARGTIGYIAPEMVCRNFGGVSYKSDVYSYGMMVLEMVGGRKNIDVGVSQTSEIYFPSWIYSNLDRSMNLDPNGVTDEEEEIRRKLIIVSLWCI
ncbi:putative receptor-like protein kinase [Hibiscus syriacus]|uniref:non-specific serine/threonine protein kinase n=1 Tax=Hibiscus syriacus TaxID=106335 RepID=A0A6A2X991_HIBSY|nr:putative receptor-like protein kinase [Hibiscus syriacus]